MLSQVVDVQLLAIARGLGSRAQMPSLRSACAAFLGANLAKEEQRSEWGHRPLRAKQRDYAALDAVAPLLLYRKLTQDASRVARRNSMTGECD